MREIQVRKSTSREVGSCNACLDHTSQFGIELHDVYEVLLRSTSFRVCPKCRRELLEKLSDRKLT